MIETLTPAVASLAKDIPPMILFDIFRKGFFLLKDALELASHVLAAVLLFKEFAF
jgi:hypothetical protein